jgi:Tol biopolymer transport system component
MPEPTFTRREVLGAGLTTLAAGVANRPASAAPSLLIGYTELRTNLPGGRHANVTTMRARVVRADGAGGRTLAEALVQEPHAWTQFAGWSPDGRTAVIGRGWESPENARWEEEHKTFRFTPEGWLYDSHLLDLASGRSTNVTAVERVSFYNSGLFFWPGDPDRLGFQALIGGESHPFAMDRDGRNKRDLTKERKGFAYGFSSSPDGRKIAYHQDYQVYIADADGSDARRVETGRPFNFNPQWSPDGQRLLFLSGEHYNCHPHVVRSDGSGLRKIGDRQGYRGVVEFLDAPDFHGGSSDTPVWSRDGRRVYYTALVDGTVELMRATPEGKTQRLSHSPPGTLHYHPSPSPDGDRLVFGSRRGGVRQLYVSRADGSDARPITAVPVGSAAMWPHWQPR